MRSIWSQENICVDQISEKPPKSSLKRAWKSLQIGQKKKNMGPNKGWSKSKGDHKVRREIQRPKCVRRSKSVDWPWWQGAGKIPKGAFSRQRACGLDGVWAYPRHVMFQGFWGAHTEPLAKGCDFSECFSLLRVEFMFRQSYAFYKPPLEQDWIFIVCIFMHLWSI